MGQLTGPQRLEPDAIGLLANGARKLSLHAWPYVLQLSAHGSVNPLLLGESDQTLDRGPAEGPVWRLYPTLARARSGCPHLARKIHFGSSVLYFCAGQSSPDGV
jgi:hypothetical protein